MGEGRVPDLQRITGPLTGDAPQMRSSSILFPLFFFVTHLLDLLL